MVLNINEYFENERKRREEGKNDLVKYTYERFKALDVPVELSSNKFKLIFELPKNNKDKQFIYKVK